MDPSAIRVPDGIEPLVGYRCWSYSAALTGVALYPVMRMGVGHLDPSPWTGAESRWVKAHCFGEAPISRLHAGRLLCEILGVAPEAPGGAVPKAAPSHEVPMEDCSCGFYAMRDLDRGLVDMSLYGMLTQRAQLYVLGRVLLAGKVIEHAEGYRAERARIAELIPVKGTEEPVSALAAALGLPMSAPV